MKISRRWICRACAKWLIGAYKPTIYNLYFIIGKLSYKTNRVAAIHLMGSEHVVAQMASGDRL